ncbi:MAG: arginine deiminase family protein [Candidatus Thermoplasmatota archaeon]|jgi:arginine deiminase|nr:arginine deiminase family protein [Candidatus Thermoplasmatota archaeon]
MNIRSEWDPLKEVMMHRPGTEIDYAMLAPKAFLFERPFKSRVAVQEHENLELVLKENGVRVRLLRNTVVDAADQSPDFRQELEQKVLDTVRFFGNLNRSGQARAELERNIKYLDSSTLFSIITLEPSIDLKEDSEPGSEYPTVYSNVPLANLYFMRDQQAVVPGGVIFGKMKRLQRMKEPEITQFVISRALREKNSVTVSENGVFEGGDFMPAGKFALIGTGSRTNLDGAMQAIRSGLLDFDEIAVVNNPLYDFMAGSPKDPMVNMHLDTYFNLAGDGVAVGAGELMRKAELTIYSGKGSDRGTVMGKDTLYSYLKKKGFSLVELSLAEQLGYSSNFLTLRDRKIVAVNVAAVLDRLLGQHVFPDYVEREVKKDLENKGRKDLFPNTKAVRDHGIDHVEVKLSELTGGYGGAHCMTAALSR